MKEFKFIIGLIVGILAYFAIQQIFFKPVSFDNSMTEIAGELNKTCPFMIDQDTRLDNVVALPNHIFQYNYTLVNWDKTEVNIDTAKKYIEPELIKNIKTNPKLKIFRDNKVTMTYNYRDKNGIFVLEITVTPDMYKGL